MSLLNLVALPWSVNYSHFLCSSFHFPISCAAFSLVNICGWSYRARRVTRCATHRQWLNYFPLLKDFHASSSTITISFHAFLFQGALPQKAPVSRRLKKWPFKHEKDDALPAGSHGILTTLSLRLCVCDVHEQDSAGRPGGAHSGHCPEHVGHGGEGGADPAAKHLQQPR